VLPRQGQGQWQEVLHSPLPWVWHIGCGHPDSMAKCIWLALNCADRARKHAEGCKDIARLGLLGEKPKVSILATMRPASSGGSISTSIGNFVYSSRAPQKLGGAIEEARNQQPSIQDCGEPFLFGAHGTGEAWCEGAPFQTSCFFVPHFLCGRFLHVR